MKMRKLFAGIAAAATMLGGLALGASTATAASTDDATLTVNNAQEGHTYTAYKIAEFANPTGDANDQKLTAVEVNTVKTPDWATALNNAFTAAQAEDANNTALTVPTEYSQNPAAYLATLGAADARKVIDKLTVPTGVASAELDQPSGTSKSATVKEGWYIVTDTWNVTENEETVQKSGPTALVATQITDGTGDAKKTYTKFKLDKENGQADNINDALGVFNAKSENAPTIPEKTVENVTTKVDDHTVNVGDTLQYTIKHTIPAAAAGYDDYKYVITDTAGKGLTIDTMSIKVTVAGETDPLTVNTDYTVTPDTNLSDGTTTVITLESLVANQHAGKQLTVTYTATVNSDILLADNMTAENEAKVTTNGGDSGSGTYVKAYGFKFTKVGVDKQSNALAGAQFVVKKGDKFLAYNESTEAWSLVDEQNDAKVFISNDKGLVELTGLSSGQYTVVETVAPDGYAQNFKVTFDVSIDKDGKITFEQDNLHQVTITNNGKTNATATVKNVKSVTQLPLTGAAGTALFTVIGLLLAGAAVTVFAKSRSTKRALMA